LEFLDYYIDPPRYSIDECIMRGLTYSVPLKAKLKLYCTDPDHEDFDTVIQDVYLGPIPYMTERGTFVINGAERVIVSQLVRSPSVYFNHEVDKNGRELITCSSARVFMRMVRNCILRVSFRLRDLGSSLLQISTMSCMLILTERRSCLLLLF